MTGSTAELEAGQLGENSLDRTVGTGQLAQDNWTEWPWHDNQDKTKRTGYRWYRTTGQDSRGITARTGRRGQSRT
jgi:hypothetical protein